MSRRFLFVLGACAALGACNANTGGHLTALPFRIGGVARDTGGTLVLSASGGWQVELDQALMAVGPFYFNVQPPETSTLQSGVVIMEALDQIAVDVLDPTLYPVDGGVSGETGRAISAEVDLFPPCAAGAAYGGGINAAACFADSNLSFLRDIPFANSTTYAVAWISGTATLGSTIIPFHGPISIDLSNANQGDPAPALQRSSAACDVTFSVDSEVLEGRIDPTSWFDGVNFPDLIPPSPCGPGADAGCDAGTTIPPQTWAPSSPFNAALREHGVKLQTGVYLFDLAGSP